MCQILIHVTEKYKTGKEVRECRRVIQTVRAGVASLGTRDLSKDLR